jgi:succinoglycan biosynthesis transport protein ExoP
VGGARTILIDADLRNPALSAQWAPGKRGLAEILAGKISVEDAVLKDLRSGLNLLTAGERLNVAHTHEWVAGEAMAALIGALRETYDYVVVDLPPLAPVVDARASAGFVDHTIFVVEWGVTRIEAARQALKHAPEIAQHLLGVVINKADMARLKRYERDFSRFDHAKYGSRYGPPEARAGKAAQVCF